MSLGLNELRINLELLTGQKCWSVIAGSGTGSTIHLAFGAQIPRAKPIRNKMLSAAQNANDGELVLFIECAWRLERNDEVVCGSSDADRNDGPMVEGLARLVGQSVTSLQMSEPVPDLVLHFSEGLCLRVFCDQTNLETNYDNYFVGVGDTITVVCARGRIAVEKAESN